MQWVKITLRIGLEKVWQYFVWQKAYSTAAIYGLCVKNVHIPIKGGKKKTKVIVNWLSLRVRIMSNICYLYI